MLDVDLVMWRGDRRRVRGICQHAEGHFRSAHRERDSCGGASVGEDRDERLDQRAPHIDRYDRDRTNGAEFNKHTSPLGDIDAPPQFMQQGVGHVLGFQEQAA